MTPEQLANFDKTLQLGKELVEGLPEHDALGRWMSHHIADLIVRAEAATGEQAQDIRRETAATILELWDHRAHYPDADHPLEAFDPVFDALARLSTATEPWSFYGMFEDSVEPGPADISNNALLRHALTLEDVVRDVVRQIVAAAAREAFHREAQWIKLTEHLHEDDHRRAVKDLARLMREVRGQARQLSGDQGAADEPPLKSPLVAALRSAESDIQRVRLALEQALADGAELDLDEE